MGEFQRFGGGSTIGDFKVVVRRKCYACDGTGKAGGLNPGGHFPTGIGASDDCPSCEAGWQRQTEDVSLEELLMALGKVSGRGAL